MTTSISGGSIGSASLREALAGNAKRLNVCAMMILLHIHSKRLSVRSQVCPMNKNKVLIPIKLLVVSILYNYMYMYIDTLTPAH